MPWRRGGYSTAVTGPWSAASSEVKSTRAEGVIGLAWLRRLTTKSLRYSVQYHADRDLDELRAHWGSVAGIDGATISLQRKSNSGQPKGRIWRSRYGVLTVWAGDTLPTARLQAWIDRVRMD